MHNVNQLSENKLLPLVNVSDLTVCLNQKTILAEVHLTVHPNEIVTIIGPNGAGKSTLLRAILGLVPIKRGKIERLPGLRIGYMPQKLSIDPFLPLSVERFLEVAGGGKAVGESIPKTNLESTTKMLGIHALLKSPLINLSGGEMQRVLLARALLKKPDLLILDEPGQGVDVLGQEELYQRIRDIRDNDHCGILMVSHDLHLVMAETDSVICLNKHVCCSGNPETVTRHPEFLNLFGLTAEGGIAIYTHRHNHRHDIDGEVCS